MIHSDLRAEETFDSKQELNLQSLDRHAGTLTLIAKAFFINFFAVIVPSDGYRGLDLAN